jgi:hypothetical protein
MQPVWANGERHFFFLLQQTWDCLASRGSTSLDSDSCVDVTTIGKIRTVLTLMTFPSVAQTCTAICYLHYSVLPNTIQKRGTTHEHTRKISYLYKNKKTYGNILNDIYAEVDNPIFEGIHKYTK